MTYDPDFLGFRLELPDSVAATNLDSASAPIIHDTALRVPVLAVMRETAAARASIIHGLLEHSVQWLIVLVARGGEPAAYGFFVRDDEPARTRMTSIAEIEGRVPGAPAFDELKQFDASAGDEAVRIRRALRDDKSPQIAETCWRELADRKALDLGDEVEIAVPLLVEVVDREWSPPSGVAISSRLGSIVSVQATEAGMTALRGDASVTRVEPSRAGGTYDSATSVPFVMGDSLRYPSLQGEDGARALVAIVDGGIDVRHGCFLDAHGRSRIVGIWDQRDPTDPSPRACGFEASYGTYHTEDAIAAYVAVGTELPRLGRDPGGHGTHVASIAAGRACASTDGTPSFAGGMAPGAQLLIVVPKLVTGPDDPNSIGYSSSHADALSFIDAFARARSIPVVVNISMGMNAGAHDGKTLLEAAFDRFSDGGREPGRAIVKSAGNEFGHGGHANLTPFEGLQEIAWHARPGNRVRDYFEAWFDSSLDLELVLITPSGQRSRPVNHEITCVDDRLDGNRCSLLLTRFHADNGDTQVVVEIAQDVDAIRSGEWRLEILGRRVIGQHTLHMWVERDDRRLVSFSSTAGATNEHTISIPGTARSVITVGAIAPRLPLRLLPASSFGPTRDHRRKPDVCAPGIAVVGASGGAGTVAMTGTSQAAPHVTGAIALLFSREAALGTRYSNAAQIQSAITTTSQRFANAWHPGFGYGVVDTLAFIHALVHSRQRR